MNPGAEPFNFGRKPWNRFTGLLDAVGRRWDSRWALPSASSWPSSWWPQPGPEGSGRRRDHGGSPPSTEAAFLTSQIGRSSPYRNRAERRLTRHAVAVSPRINPLSDKWLAEREHWAAAGRIAQAAHSRDDLVELLTTHPDYRVRCEAIPRLRARFPSDEETLAALAHAARSFDAVVRETAVGALGDLGTKAAAEAVVSRLTDPDPEVRAAAGNALVQLGDPRAPADLEDWLRRNRPTDYEDCGE